MLAIICTPLNLTYCFLLKLKFGLLIALLSAKVIFCFSGVSLEDGCIGRIHIAEFFPL